MNVTYLGDYFDHIKLSKSEITELSGKLASIYISDIEKESQYLSPDSGMIRNESDYIANIKPQDRKILYDGNLLTSIYFLPLLTRHPTVVKDNEIHVVYTSRLFCTFGDKRYHARVVLTGIPSLISTSGLVEAPAKPREYYWLKASFIHGGMNIEELNEMFRGRFVAYDDPKITEILYSYTLQVIFYYLTGDPFCPDKNCCLYNSHWQEEVLSSQLRGELCKNHRKIINSYSQI